MFHCNENNSDKDQSLKLSDYQRFNKAVKNTGRRACNAASLGFGVYRLQICAATKQAQGLQA